MKLQDIYFEKIKSGTKIYEIRLNDSKRQQIKAGDLILFRKITNLDENLLVSVEKLLHFDSFSQMLKALPKKEIGFENETEKEIENVFHTFYSPQDEQKFGVVAIKVKTK